MSDQRKYADAYEAIDQAIASTGRSRKELATICYPGRRIETAVSLFSRALSPENTDVNLQQEMVETILDNTRADDYIFYLCDKYGFERPPKKKVSAANEVRLMMQQVYKLMGAIESRLPAMEQEEAGQE